LQSQYFGSIFTALQEERLSIFWAKQSSRLALLEPEDGGYTFLWHIVNIPEDMNLINTGVRMSINMFINSFNTVVQQTEPAAVNSILKLTGYVVHQQVKHSTTVCSTHTVFMCFVLI